MNPRGDAHYKRQRVTAFERDRGLCVVGGACPAEQVHHRQGRGGPDPHRLSNLISVCAAHHGQIHASPAWAYENGFMVRRNGVLRPEDVPVRYGTELIHLTNSWEPR